MTKFISCDCMHTIMVRQARCSHILVETQAEAYEIQNMIYNGADFAQLAAQRS